MFNATIMNMHGPCEIVIDGELRTREGEMVISFRTDRIALSAGSNLVTAGGVALRSFEYGSGDAGRSARHFQRLPGGEYRYCLRLDAPQAEARDEYCDRVKADALYYLDLVRPWNGDSIDEVRPALTWTLSGPDAWVSGADVRIVLVPMDKVKPAQALASQRPLFMVPHVKERTMPYPAGIPDLERGKCYAWQAELLDGRRVVDRSEPWGFCVRRRKEVVPSKYVKLDRVAPGVVYEVVDGRIYFRYDEPYASDRVDCSIHDGRGKRMEPELREDASGSGSAGVRHVGVNLYELDLQPYRLTAGHYDLVVRNEKGRVRTLKFHITP